MKINAVDLWRRPVFRKSRKGKRGFSLVELMVAMAIFLVVSATGFALFNQQQAAFSQELGQVGLNIFLRNSIGMIQMDVANSGSGVLPGANVPSFPVGVTFSIPPAGTCHTAGTTTYTASCFGKLNIIAGDATARPVNASDNTGAAGLGNCSNTNTPPAYGQAAATLTLAQTAAQFPSGTQILFLTNSGQRVTTAVLTSAATVAGAAVRFNFNATTATGQNTVANDPLSISTQALTNSIVNDTSTDTTASSNQLGNQFCGNDWIIKLAPIIYQVDTTTASKPILTRTQSGTTSNIMEQVVGFRLGATVWNDGAGGVNTTFIPYYYDPAGFPAANDFSLVRSVRIALIARTTPNPSPTYHFRNLFDGGPYQILGSSVVVNPRNLSMND